MEKMRIFLILKHCEQINNKEGLE